MNTTVDTPKVWIACLASYNAGRLIGKWVDATDVDTLNEGQKEVAEKAWKEAVKCGDAPVYFGYPEEFAIHDYDGFGSLSSRLGEYPSYKTVAKLGALIEEYGEAFLGYLDAIEHDLDEVDEDSFQSCYRNEWDSEEDFAIDYSKELGIGGIHAQWEKPDAWKYNGQDKYVNIVEELADYIDWDKVVQELFDHGQYSSRPCSAGGVHVYEEGC